MPQNDVIDKAEALKRIAAWLGWRIAENEAGDAFLYPGDRPAYIINADVGIYEWNPFANLRYAFDLQDALDRRGLRDKYMDELCKDFLGWKAAAWHAAVASADQRTRAVLAVIEQEAANV